MKWLSCFPPYTPLELFVFNCALPHIYYSLKFERVLLEFYYPAESS